MRQDFKKEVQDLKKEVSGALILKEDAPVKFSVSKLSRLDWYILGVSVCVLVFTALSSYFEKYHISVPLSFWSQEKVFVPLAIFILFVTLVFGYAIFIIAIPLHLSWMNLLCAFQRTKYYQSRIRFWALFCELLYFLKRYGLILFIWWAYLSYRCYKSYAFLTWTMIFYSVGISTIYGSLLAILIPFQRKVISKKISKEMQYGLYVLFRTKNTVLSLSCLLFFPLLVLELTKKAYPSLFSELIFQVLTIGIVLLLSVLLAWYISVMVRGFENISLRVLILLTVFLSFLIGSSPIGARIGKSGLYMLRAGGDIPVRIGVDKPEVCRVISGEAKQECLSRSGREDLSLQGEDESPLFERTGDLR